MTPAALAKALRRRQLRLEQRPKSEIHALSDEEIILAYMRCSRCGAPLFEDDHGPVVISRSVDDFVALVGTALEEHGENGCEQRH